MKKYFLIFFVLLILERHINAKVVLFTYAFNRPDFVELQYKTLKKFLKDDYEFIIFNDAVDEILKREIQNVCQKLNLRCILIPQEIHDQPYLERLPGFQSDNQSRSVRNCNVVQYSLDYYGFDHDDILVLLDGDIFLTRDFSFRTFIRGYDIAAYLRPCYDLAKHSCDQEHPKLGPISYLWIGLVVMDMKTLPNRRELNFNCGMVFRKKDEIRGEYKVDSGGYTFYYLDKYSDLKVKNISRVTNTDIDKVDITGKKVALSLDFSQKSLNLINLIKKWSFQFYYGDTFFHYKAATKAVPHAKDTFVRAYLSDLLAL